MLTTATQSSTTEIPPTTAAVAPRALKNAFTFIGERLWLDFVNTDGAAHDPDTIADFDLLVSWLETAVAFDAERAQMMRRRAVQQPSGATAALMDARRVRAALRSLAEQGSTSPQVRL